MKKPFAILLVSCVLGIGAGFGGGMYISPAPADAAESKAKAIEKEIVEPEVDPVLIDLDTVRIPVYQGRKVSYVTAFMKLALADAESAEIAKTMMPKIMATVFKEMTQFSSGGMFGGLTIDSEALSSKLTERLDRLDDEMRVHDLVFRKLIKSG